MIVKLKEKNLLHVLKSIGSAVHIANTVTAITVHVRTVRDMVPFFLSKQEIIIPHTPI